MQRRWDIDNKSQTPSLVKPTYQMSSLTTPRARIISPTSHHISSHMTLSWCSQLMVPSCIETRSLIAGCISGSFMISLWVTTTRSGTFYWEALSRDPIPRRTSTHSSSLASVTSPHSSARGSWSGMHAIKGSIGMIHSSSLLLQMWLELWMSVAQLATTQDVGVN